MKTSGPVYVCDSCGHQSRSLFDRDVHSLQAHGTQPGSTVAPEPQKVEACVACGSAATLNQCGVNEIDYWMHCNRGTCEMQGPTRKSADEAIAEWNKIAALRSSNAALAARCADLLGLLARAELVIVKINGPLQSTLHVAAGEWLGLLEQKVKAAELDAVLGREPS